MSLYMYVYMYPIINTCMYLYICYVRIYMYVHTYVSIHYIVEENISETGFLPVINFSACLGGGGVRSVIESY